MTQHILVVDDDASIRESIVELLEDRGYIAHAAGDGAEGLQALRSREPWSLILLDLMMPVMDGWAMRKELLADPRLAGIPVVVLSAVPNVAAAATDLEAAGFLPKPARLGEIVAAVQRHAY